MNTFATLFNEAQVTTIHEASLEILAEVGLLVHNEKARAIFARHGCALEAETEIVRFPRRVIEDYRAAFPATFTFHGRDPQTDRTLPADRPVIVTGSSAPNLIDPLTGCERRATSADIARIAHLINELPGYDVFSISTLAEDAPPGQFTLARAYPAVKNCRKPVRTTVTDAADAERVLQMAYRIAGGEAAFHEHPFLTFHFCPVVSPLTMDVSSTEMVIYFAERGLPVYGSYVPNAGLTSPMTLAGTIAQCNAEFLAAAVLMQMVRPGTPQIYATLPTVADMRTGAYASGGIECGLLHMAFAQLARFYGVPCGGYIGLSNAKVNDAQSGYETGMSCTAGVLAGADMLNMGGLLDALKAFDYGKAVIDDEIALMLKRIVRGVELDPENLAQEVIARVGPGGTYMLDDHTRRWMRKTALIPKIADREARHAWELGGALDARARALHRARQILERDNPAVFSPEVDARLRAEFAGLVAGDSLPLD
jgi:trimethylamine--corrinoid protein Co-methyltransferase